MPTPPTMSTTRGVAGFFFAFAYAGPRASGPSFVLYDMRKS
jgi:hypothetical protein